MEDFKWCEVDYIFKVGDFYSFKWKYIFYFSGYIDVGINSFF